MGSNLHYAGLARKVSSLNIDLIDFNNVFVLYAFLVFFLCHRVRGYGFILSNGVVKDKGR